MVKNNNISLFRLSVIVAACLAIVVVMLGAYTRLTNAGLGCPDWPGCYGHIIAPSGLEHGEGRKAWTEMLHRYAAGSLALLIFYIGFKSAYFYRKKIKLPILIPLTLVLLVLFQAALGMWTVTLKLLPLVVMMHLLGGILIFSLLTRLAVELSFPVREPRQSGCFWLGLGLIVLFIQIGLGGWVSANYAGIACIGFPRCNGVWLPALDFTKGFNLLSYVGQNHQGGLLDNDARAAIQMIHRLGALVTFFYLGGLCLFLRRKCSEVIIKKLSSFIFAILLVQVSLGIVNVVYLLPLWSAVAHNGLAALLLGSLFTLTYFVCGGKNDY